MDRETKREIIMDYSKDTTHRGLIMMIDILKKIPEVTHV